MAKRETKKAADKPPPPLGSPERPPITLGEVTATNPAGIESVDPEHARNLGELRGAGGPGASGATVLGAVGYAATKGGAEPLPTRDDDLHENKFSSGQTATEGAREGENLGSSNPGADHPGELGEPENTGAKPEAKAPAAEEEQTQED